MAIGPRLKASIVEKGLVPSDRALWIHLDHPTLGKTRILAIYAPNGRRQRAALWHELDDTIDNKRIWIVTGDFNNVEESADRRGGSGRIMSGVELRALHHFKRKF